MSNRVSGKEAAISVLREAGKPMPVKELTAEAVKRVRPKMEGKTPTATIAAIIYTSAKKGVTFKKTGRGEIALLDEDTAEAEAQGETPATEDDPLSPVPGATVIRDGAKADATPDPKPGRRGRRQREPVAA